MGRYDSYDDDDDLDQQESNDNSSPIRDLRRANSAKDKKIRDLEERLNKALEGQRDRSIRDVVSSKGLNPKVAALVPKDLTDEESIQKWLDDYADVFGMTGGSDAPTIDEQDAASLQSMDRTMAGGQSPAGPEAMIERIKSMPFEELDRLIAGSGQ